MGRPRILHDQGFSSYTIRGSFHIKSHGSCPAGSPPRRCASSGPLSGIPRHVCRWLFYPRHVRACPLRRGSGPGGDQIQGDQSSSTRPKHIRVCTLAIWHVTLLRSLSLSDCFAWPGAPGLPGDIRPKEQQAHFRSGLCTCRSSIGAGQRAYRQVPKWGTIWVDGRVNDGSHAPMLPGQGRGKKDTKAQSPSRTRPLWPNTICIGRQSKLDTVAVHLLPCSFVLPRPLLHSQ